MASNVIIVIDHVCYSTGVIFPSKFVDCITGDAAATDANNSLAYEFRFTRHDA